MESITNKYDVLVRLTQSVGELENAIATTKQFIQNKVGYPSYAIERLDCYMEIVNQQREQFPVITRCIDESNYQDLLVSCNKVKALSEMIKEDAAELLRKMTDPDFKIVRLIVH
jgi:lipopolysaccharide biosynthesis regulator YciM